jgi:hypothetical protein
MTGISLRKICSDHEIRCRHGPAAGASCVLVSQYPPWGTDATSLAAVRKDPEAGIRIICECRSCAPSPAHQPELIQRLDDSAAALCCRLQTRRTSTQLGTF